MIGALERAGHRCTIYLHNLNGWSIDQCTRGIRHWWPWVRADVVDVTSGLHDCHAVFATGWETAYVLLGSDAKGVRCYLVQDFEPLFSPAGSASLLAEGTYRFGFVGVTAGRWLAELLHREYGMTTSHFDFGCDISNYPYRPEVDDNLERRGYLLLLPSNDSPASTRTSSQEP